MGFEDIPARVASIAGVVLMLAGVIASGLASNPAKRVVAHVMCIAGGLLAGAALGAPVALLLSGAAIALAYLSVGAALTVRLSEAYESSAVEEIDAANAQADAAELQS